MFITTTDRPQPIVGVLLAAGRGRRMGCTKQLLPIATPSGMQPLVVAAFDGIRDFCDSMIVVVGADSDKVTKALEPRKFHVVASDPDADMVHSAKSGMRAALDAINSKGLLLHLADHPWLQGDTCRLILEQAVRNTNSVVVPTYRDRGGHPAWIPAEIAKQILGLPLPGGLRQFWQENAELVTRVAVDDPGVVRDIDTPADLTT